MPDVDADATALHELDALSFSTNADYEPETLAQWQAEHLGAHDLDAAPSRVAEGEAYERPVDVTSRPARGRPRLRAFQTSSHGHR